MFKAYLPEIPKNEKIVFPISMSQRVQKGESLSATLKAFEENGYKQITTILVCDYLDRFNTNEEESIRNGNKFLEDYKNALNGFNVIRWKDFLESRDKTILNLKTKKIEEEAKEGTIFNGKMKKTWKKLNSQSGIHVQNSIKYQIEEYATILCMDDFDHIFYPQKMSDGMLYLYNFIEDKKPKFHQIKISEFKNTADISPLIQQFSFIQNGTQKKGNHIHIAFRGLLQQMEVLLDSSELSVDSKKAFKDEAERLFLAHGLIKSYFPEQDTDSKTLQVS